MDYRDVQYLILILRRFYYDLLKCVLSVGVTVLKPESRKVVYFFFTPSILNLEKSGGASGPPGPPGSAGPVVTSMHLALYNGFHGVK